MKSYNDIYMEIYKKVGNHLEEMRKKTKSGYVSIIISLILMIITLFFIITTSNIIFLILLVITIIVFVKLFFDTSKNNKKYRNMFKKEVIETFIKEYSDKLEYYPQEGILRREYRDGEFENFDIFYSEDLIKGIIAGDCKIRMSEVHTENESRDEDGNTTRTTIFWGLVGVIKLNKIVNTNMRIRKNSISLFSNKDKIEMDSSEFEKIFNVYSTNKIIAMQLLTADIMQMFIDFKNENKITPEITLKRNEMYIRFKTGNLFEASLMKNSLDFRMLYKYYSIINFTLDLTEKMLKNIKETEL